MEIIHQKEKDELMDMQKKEKKELMNMQQQQKKPKGETRI